MDRILIHKKIIEISEAKKKHLQTYESYIESLAKNKSTLIFLTGSCSDCEKYDKEILELEQLLKIQ